MKKIRTLSPIWLIASFIAVGLVSTKTFAGIDGWNPGNIMSVGVFTNKSTMSTGDIQNFLNSKVASCDTQGSKTSEYGGPDLNGDGRVTRAEYAKSKGVDPPFTCIKNYSQDGKSAAQIIYEASQDFSINPQVLIVLLQKEQGLITDEWPWPIQYRAATGYGCPDTADCSAEYYGFTNQVRWASRMFRSIVNADPGWYTPYVLGNNYIQYNPESSCGGSNVNVENRSTQALYNYTPYQPNQGALDAGWGTAPCGAYGNRNFYLYFTSWFGSTQTSNPYSWILDRTRVHADSARTRSYTTTNPITVQAGTSVHLQVKGLNIGYKAWGKTNTYLGTTQNRDRSSIFKDGSWVSANRIALKETTVSPGTIGTFEFSLTAPSQTGSYTECFRPVIEGVTWTTGNDHCLRIDVVTRDNPNTLNTRLDSGASLTRETHLMSTSTNSVLVVQTDGNLVLYNNGRAAWATGTPGTSSNRLVMQTDGNLVLYDKNNQAKWASNTHNNPGAHLRIQADGNLVLYNSSNTPIWSSGTENIASLDLTIMRSVSSTNLYPEQRLQTASRKYKMLLQRDGNLVVYSSNKAVWASNTAGKTVSRASMQTDGNLVLYDKSNKAVWASNTAGQSQSRVLMQDDGNLVIYTPAGSPAWATATNGR